MKTCHSCGCSNDEKHSFCLQCGASLAASPSRADQGKRNVGGSGRLSGKKGTRITLFALVLVLAVGLFTSYHFLAKKYSKEEAIEQFTAALISKDKEAVKELLVPADSRLKVNNQSIDALFSLLDEEPSLIQDIENSLRDEKLGANMFFLREDGKHFGHFDRYVVDTLGYFITIEDPGVETTIFLNESEVGVLDGSQNSLEVGPLLAGSYKVKVVYKKEGKTHKDATAVKLTGTKALTEVALEIQPEEKEQEEAEEEVKEKTVIKEVIREVPVSGGNHSYLLPHSRYAYLTYSDIAGLTKSQLRVARNEIYARHGYIFKSQDLKAYFYSQDWYIPDPTYNGTLSSIEQYNVNFIKSYE